MEGSELVAVRMYCPNCGSKVIGYRNRDGTVRLVCDKCKAIMLSRRKNERTTEMRLTKIAR